MLDSDIFDGEPLFPALPFIPLARLQTIADLRGYAVYSD